MAVAVSALAIPELRGHQCVVALASDGITTSPMSLCCSLTNSAMWSATHAAEASVATSAREVRRRTQHRPPPSVAQPCSG
jgi:hypothetical protein